MNDLKKHSLCWGHCIENCNQEYIHIINALAETDEQEEVSVICVYSENLWRNVTTIFLRKEKHENF